jgi:bifunctional N-acetylglucosamine-1-phosphate-uridyltransferase/glucosamine-1-phosphate-acetyltransferase GlmU-like protein
MPIGNFVELKKTVMGKGAKGESAYLGDATIGAQSTSAQHHHVQLRRRAEAPDRDRQQRLRGQQQHVVAPVTLADGSYIAGLRGHGGCAGRRARHWPFTPGKQRELGGEAKDAKAKN